LKSEVKKKMMIELRKVVTPKSWRENFQSKSQLNFLCRFGLHLILMPSVYQIAAAATSAIGAIAS
jgi:hypothetical protein